MGLKQSYSLLAPFYDLVVAGATKHIRKNSIEHVNRLSVDNDKILICGIGTGLDIPFLAPGRQYTGIDLTPAMLKKAQSRIGDIPVELQLGDVMNLPFTDNSFDIVIMHLIVAVVIHPGKALQEAQRVVKNGGHVIVMDKFLKSGQLALLRRLINPLTRQIATQTNVVFEEQLKHCSQLSIVSDEPVLASGWFRRIHLTKQK